MSNFTDSILEGLHPLSDSELRDRNNRLDYSGTPTLDLASLGITQTDPVLVNNGSTEDDVLLCANAYFDIIFDALPLFYRSERALAERMDRFVTTLRAEQVDKMSLYPSPNQLLDLHASFFDLAGKLTVIQRRLGVIFHGIMPSVLSAEPLPGIISLSHSLSWAKREVGELIKQLTRYSQEIIDIEAELEVICNARVRTARTFREMSTVLSHAMNNGIDYTALLNAPPA